MKKVLSLLLVILTVLVFTGCGTNTAPNTANKPEDTTQPASAGKIRIALILPATVDDMAWGQSMVEGLKAVQKTMGADKVEIATNEKLGNPVDAGAAIRQFADKGYDIIIAHGSQYQSVLMDIAKDFPKTTFAYGSAFTTAPNVFAYDPQAQEGGYLLGMLAAKLTKTGTVGIVGPMDSGDAVTYDSGIEQGVAKGNPNVKVRKAFTGSFDDIVGAGNLAKTEMSAGADILTGSSQQAVGALKAVAATKGNYWLSTDMDQSSAAPDTVLAAQAYDWQKVITNIINLRKQGTLGGKHLILSFADGTIKLVYNPKLAGKIPADVKAAVDQAQQDITSGKLKVEVKK